MPPGRAPSFFAVLPVLFLEFLASSIAKGVLPHRLVAFYGAQTYSVIAVVETLKGLLAFYFCPYLGRLSDSAGRRPVLWLTVLGTCAPFCALAFTDNLWYYVAAQALAGAFAATFAITFAYIADTVAVDERAPAYGLALATFGLSFCVGPVSGSYLAQRYGQRAVFGTTVLLTLLDLAYISLLLPESVAQPQSLEWSLRLPRTPILRRGPMPPGKFRLKDAVASMQRVRQNFVGDWLQLAHGAGDVAHSLPTRLGVIFSDAVAILLGTPLLRRVSEIVFLYYCGVWALVTTLMIYVTRHLHFSTIMVGQLMSAYGLCTMISEGVLVRILVPLLGESVCVVVGLVGFTVQCVIIAFANEPWVIYLSMSGALLANLFYPSISALISRTVTPEQQGEALGALNGIKSLCEGVGPLIFGTLMTSFETTALPGAPYLLAALATAVAAVHALDLPRLVEQDMEEQRLRQAQDSEKQSLLNARGDAASDDEEDAAGASGAAPEGRQGGSRPPKAEPVVPFAEWQADLGSSDSSSGSSMVHVAGSSP